MIIEFIKELEEAGQLVDPEVVAWAREVARQSIVYFCNIGVVNELVGPFCVNMLCPTEDGGLTPAGDSLGVVWYCRDRVALLLCADTVQREWGLKPTAPVADKKRTGIQVKGHYVEDSFLPITDNKIDFSPIHQGILQTVGENA